MFHDLRFGLRMLLKQPGFTLIAALTLALGIGATSAVFSLIQGVLLTPPPYRNPHEIVLIPSSRTDGQQMSRPRGWPSQQWLEWQKEASSLSGIAAYGWTFNFLIDSEGSESIEGMTVTGDYFRVVGLQPVLGRTFLESETSGKPAPVLILGYELWQRKFNADPAIIGKQVRISRRETAPTVIGIMPPGVRFLPSPPVAQEPNYNVNAFVDFWMPAAPDPKGKQPWWNLAGRLKEGATIQKAESELRVLAARQAQAEPEFQGIAPQVQPLSDELNRQGRGILLPLLGAAGLVLLIACGNVAALLLVRGIQRQGEYAVRRALGISGLALFRQVCAESVLLAVAGGVLGVALAFGTVHVMKLVGGHAIPRLDAVTTAWPVLAFGLAAALLAALLAGLIPALRALRLDPNSVLKSAGPKSSTGPGERRLLRGVATMQTALTLALLVGAGLLIRTMINVSSVDSGYNTNQILTMTVTSVQGDWSEFHARALERVTALSGVQNAAFAWGVPLTGNNWPGAIEIEGQPSVARQSDRLSLPLRSVTPDYFASMRLHIIEGRDFRATDKRDAPRVAIVNQALADRYFAGGNAIGKKLWMGGRERPSNEIIGIVSNARTDDLTQAAGPEIYVCLWQMGAFSKHLVVRTAGDPLTMAAAVRRELRSVDPTVSVENVKTLDDIRKDSVASRTFAMKLLAGFSAVACVLTLVGIYGVLSLFVASRRREIAIRTAVGAEQRHIRKLIFAEGFRVIAGGIAAGIAAALLLARFVRSLLFGLEPADPATLLIAGLLFAAVASLACWAPTRRAAEIDPLEALRYE
jgi:putative ABC transport system permease protein